MKNCPAYREEIGVSGLPPAADKVTPEVGALIDKLVADLVDRYVATGDGLAVLSGEARAWQMLRKQCPPGRRAPAHEELRTRLNAALAPILKKIVEEDMANDRRQRAVALKRGSG